MCSGNKQQQQQQQQQFSTGTESPGRLEKLTVELNWEASIQFY